MISISIKMGMAKAGLKTQGLADKLGVRRETVSAWINGHAVPNHKRQLEMCELFGVTMSKFMEWGE